MAEEKEKVRNKQASRPGPKEEPAAAPPADEAGEQQPKTPKEEEVREEPSRPAPPVPEGGHYFWGTGRRKRSVARVRIRPGKGDFLVNKRPMDEYFRQEKDRAAVHSPLQIVHMLKSWDVFVNVGGGGSTGQAGAISLGLARALMKAVPNAEGELRGSGLLTRDPRMVERKKYGQPGARKRFQFSKR